MPDWLAAEAEAYWKEKEEADAHHKKRTARAKAAMVDVDAPQDAPPTHAP